MSTPFDKRPELGNSGAFADFQLFKREKARNPDDPVEREVTSAKAILQRVLSHEVNMSTVTADIEDIVKWWNRTEALLSMHKSGTQIMDYLAIGLAKLGIGQILDDAQYDDICQFVADNKAAIDARFKFYAGTLAGKTVNEPLTVSAKAAKDGINTFTFRVAPLKMVRR